MHPVFPCHLCKAQFFTSIERNDHLESHFTRQQCPSCSHTLILIDAELYVISPHLPSRCLKQRVDGNNSDVQPVTEISPPSKRRKSILSEPNLRVDGHTDCARKRSRKSDRIREKHMARVEAMLNDDEDNDDEDGGDVEQNENVVIQVRSRPEAWMSNAVVVDDLIIELDESDDDSLREVKDEDDGDDDDIKLEDHDRDVVALDTRHVTLDRSESSSIVDPASPLPGEAADDGDDDQTIYFGTETIDSSMSDVSGMLDTTSSNNDESLLQEMPRSKPRPKSKMKVAKEKKPRKQKSETEERSKVMCDICNEGMAKNRILSHIRFVHLGLRTLSDRECDICGMICSNTGNLKAHRMRHTHPKPFTCSYCGRGFSGQFHLNEHVNLHTGAKPHECDVCGKRFARTTTKTSHMRVHTGVKPFKCKVVGCGRDFRYNSDLRRHEYSVHGIFYTKHICHVCDKVFPERKMLNKHLQQHMQKPTD